MAKKDVSTSKALDSSGVMQPLQAKQSFREMVSGLTHKLAFLTSF